MSEKLSARFRTKDNSNSNSMERKALKFLASTAPDRQNYGSSYSLENTLNDFSSALMAKIDKTPVWFEYSESKQKELISTFVENKILSENMELSQIDKDVLIDSLLASVSGFGAVQYLIDKDNVSSVIVNGTNGIYIEINGKVLNTDTKLSDKELSFLIKAISAMSGAKIDGGINNLKLDEYNITVAGEHLCKSGINIVIKKLKKYDGSLLIRGGILNKEIYEYISALILDRKNIIISGCSNSGKTVLLTSILNTILSNKRVYLTESSPEISVDSPSFVRFQTSKYDAEYQNIISYIQKSTPDYFVSDLNYLSEDFCDINPKILTLRAPNADSALKSLFSVYMKSGMPEKYAKLRALTDFDYIIHMDKLSDGSIKLESITELVPAKTAALSVKTIVKYIDGQYISSIPQPLTSMRAKTLVIDGAVS